MIKSLLTLSVVFVCTGQANAISDQPETPEKEIAVQNNAFSFDLYKEIAKKEQGNIFYSPFSISTVLAMTYAGAKGKTAEEMASVLHFDINTPEFHRKYGAYLTALEMYANDRIELGVCNRLWLDKTMLLLDQFIEQNRTTYGASIEHVDFMNQFEKARLKINTYIAEKTKNRIQDLLPPGSINSDTRLVLTNAIYFKGDWLYKFDTTQTRVENFSIQPGEKIKTAFMHQKKYFSFHENYRYKMIKLPYKGDKHSMVIVLPNHTTDLESIANEMNQASFANLTAWYRPEVEVSLPKFSMTLSLSLGEILQNMGMKQAFTMGADFSGITDMSALLISDVIHKAFIEIDEKGTEAAAATAVITVVTSSSSQQSIEPPKTFIANHPFLFYILDNETQSILFAGRMLDPRN